MNRLTDDLYKTETVPDVVVVKPEKRRMKDEYREQYDGTSFDAHYDDGAAAPPPVQKSPNKGAKIAFAGILALIWVFFMFICPFRNEIPNADTGDMGGATLTGLMEVTADRPSTAISDEELDWIRSIAETDQVRYYIDTFDPENSDYVWEMLDPNRIPTLSGYSFDFAAISINKTNGEMYWTVDAKYGNHDGTEEYYISLDDKGKFFKNTDVFTKSGKRLYEYSNNGTYATRWDILYTHHGLISLIHDMIKYGE